MSKNHLDRYQALAITILRFGRIEWALSKLINHTTKTPVICSECNKRRWIEPAKIRKSLEAGTMSGACRQCTHIVKTSQKYPTGVEKRKGGVIDWSDVRKVNHAYLVLVQCDCGKTRYERPSAIARTVGYTARCVPCANQAKAQECTRNVYPTVPVVLEGGTIHWDRIEKRLLYGNQYPSLAILITCRHCNTERWVTRCIAKSLTTAACYDCTDRQSRHKARLLTLLGRGDQILETGAVVRWSTAYASQEKRGTQVVVACPCGLERTQYAYSVESGSVSGLCHRCANLLLRDPSANLLQPNKRRWIDPKTGYAWVYIPPDDPYYEMANKSGQLSMGERRIPEHRLVMAREKGRILERWEHVHHLGPDPANPDKSNNDPENLQLQTPDAHATITAMQREVRRLRALVGIT